MGFSVAKISGVVRELFRDDTQVRVYQPANRVGLIIERLRLIDGKYMFTSYYFGTVEVEALGNIPSRLIAHVLRGIEWEWKDYTVNPPDYKKILKLLLKRFTEVEIMMFLDMLEDLTDDEKVWIDKTYKELKGVPSQS